MLHSNVKDCLLVIATALLLLFSGTFCVADDANSAATSLVKRLKAKSAVDENGNLKSELVKETAKVMSGKEEGALAFAEAVLDFEDSSLMIVKSLVVRRFLESTLSEDKVIRRKWLARLGEKQVDNPLWQFDPQKAKQTISLKSVHDSFHQAASADKVKTRVRAIYLISMLRFGVGKAGRSKLLRLTRDPVAEVRAAALTSLFRCGVDPFVLRETVLRDTQDKSTKVRSEAVKLIGVIRKSDTVAWKASNELLRHSLSNKSSLVRISSCSALFDSRSRTALVEYRADTKLFPIVTNAIQGAKSDKELNSYVSVLVSVPTCNREVLVAYLLALPRIFKLAGDNSDDDIRISIDLEAHQASICYFVLKTSSKEALVALPLVRSLRGNEELMTRVISAACLLHIKSSDADRQWAKKTIYEALKKKRKTRWYSSYNNPYDYLQYLDPKDKKVAELWKGAFTHPSPHVRLAAITTSLKWKKKRQDAVPLIRSLLKDRDMAVQFAAAQALQSIDGSDKSLLNMLVKIMRDWSNLKELSFGANAGNIYIKDDFDYVVRGNIFSLLQELGPAAAPTIPALVQIIQKETVFKNGGFLYYSPENSARIRALLVLAAMGEKAKPALPAMLEILKQSSVDPWRNRERAAMQVLAAIGEDSHEAVPLLVKKLRESSPCLRLEAARTLGAIGSRAKAAIPVLRNLAPKSRPEVAEAINKAIKQINNTK